MNCDPSWGSSGSRPSGAAEATLLHLPWRSVAIGLLAGVSVLWSTACTNAENEAAGVVEDASLPPAAVPLRDIGRALSWDGRFAVDMSSDRTTWQAYAFAPQRLGVVGKGFPDFSEVWEKNRFTFVDAKGAPGIVPADSATHASIGMDPSFDDAEFSNPHRCTAQGAPSHQLTAYECYRIMLYFVGNSSAEDVEARVLQGVRGTVVIEAFDAGSSVRAASPKVVSAKFVGPFQRHHWRDGTGKLRPVSGWEITTTADSRLAVRTGSVYSYNFSDPFDPDAWSEPKQISQIHKEKASFAGVPFEDRYPIARAPLKDAAGDPCEPTRCAGGYPWISQDGSELFFSRAKVVQPADNDKAPARGCYSVVGARTKFTELMIDGPLNKTRFEQVAHTVSPGLMPGMWAPYEELHGTILPYSSGGTTYPIFSSGAYGEVTLDDAMDQDYLLFLPLNELTVRSGLSTSNEDEHQWDAKSDHYDVNPYEKNISHTLTPDVSGNFNTGELSSGAQFPTEFFVAYPAQREPARGENVGHVGRAVYFRAQSSIRIPASPEPGVNPNGKSDALHGEQSTLTLELAVNALSPITQGADLLRKQGSYRVFHEADGRIGAAFSLSDGQVRTLVSKHTLDPKEGWTHIGVVFNGNAGRATIYKNAEPEVFTDVPPGARVRGAKTEIRIGPASLVKSTALPVYLIDEVAISRIPRRPEHIARHAQRISDPPFVRGSALALPPGLTPPPGLSPHDMRIPVALADLIEDGTFAKAAALGKDLFSDVDLAGTGVACATCHDPNKSFIDARSDGNGARVRTSTGVLPPPPDARNTPTTMNRAFSTRQFWDGRADSLIDQALLPIANPQEMGGTIGGVMAYIHDHKGYRDRFEAIFGKGFGSQALAMSLAAFELQLFTQDSVIDRMDRDALTQADRDNHDIAALRRGQALFRGKARCNACHTGKNYSDESFHNTGAGNGTDVGRYEESRATVDLYGFKTPTLRGVRHTAPYFHDGTAVDLRQVIEHYQSGGPAGFPGLDLELRPLGLSDAEIEDLRSFLLAL